MEFSVKKLVASFLILSAVTGGLSWSFNDFGAARSGDHGGVRYDSLAADSGRAFSSTSFSEGEGVAPSEYQADNTFLLDKTSPHNITDRLAESVLRKVRLKNPDGFSTNDSGEVFGNPATEADIEKALREVGLDEIVRHEVYEGDLTVLPETDLEKLDEYLRGLAAALLTTVGSDRYGELLGDAPSLARLAEIEGFLEEAETQLLALPVPQDAIGIHKKMLGFVGSHKAFYGVVGDYENDPARTLVALQNKDTLLETDLGGLREEVTELIARHYTPEAEANFLAHIQQEFVGLFTVQEAQAFSVTDVLVGALEGTQLGEVIALVSTAASELSTALGAYTQQLLEWAQRIATEQLKNYLTKLFVQQVLQWTNNDGNQRFVYNWDSFLQDVQEETTSDAIDEFVPSLCGPYQRYVLQSQGFFGLSRRNASQVRRNCSLSRNGGLLGFFVRDFSQGGWPEYLGSITPEGNIHGAVLFAEDYVSSRTDSARANKVNELISNNGFLSQYQCADGSEPGRGDKCDDGSTPRATTPGGLVSDTLGKAFGAPLDRIVNANDLTDLLAALVNSAITGVLSSGASKIAGVVGLGSTGIRDRRAERLSDVVCGGLTGEALDTCLADAGEADSVFTETSEGTEAAEQSREVRRVAEAIKTANDKSLDIITELTETSAPGRFSGIFDQIERGAPQRNPVEILPRVPGCNYIPNEPPNPRSRDKEERRAEVAILREQITTNIPNVRSVIVAQNNEINFDELQRDVAAATSETIQSIIDRYGTPEELDLKRVVADARLTALQDIKSKAAANIGGEGAPTDPNGNPDPDDKEGDISYRIGSCDTPIPTDVFVDGADIFENP